MEIILTCSRFENCYPKWLPTIINSLTQNNQASIQTTLLFGLQIVERTLGSWFFHSLLLGSEIASQQSRKRDWGEKLGHLSSLLKLIIPILPQFLVLSQSSPFQVDRKAVAQLCEQINPDLAKSELEFYHMQWKIFLGSITSFPGWNLGYLFRVP